MLSGAIYGDICGAPYEFNPQRDPSLVNLCHPGREATDDTFLTLAVAKSIVEKRPYRDTIFEMAQAYPNAGWGGRFCELWVYGKKPVPYGSYGNGAAMRVSPIGWAFNTVEDVLREAEASAAVSHNAPEGIASAQAVALALFLARKGQDKDEIREAVESRFGYDLSPSLEAIRAGAKFDETYRSVPEAIGVFLQTDSFEDCIRQTIALGADADTQACISGAIAEAYYGADDTLDAAVLPFLDPSLQSIYRAFKARFE